MKKVLIAIVTLAVVIADAATLTVTSNADSGAGSFRSALEDACDGDTIEFDLAKGSNEIKLESKIHVPRGRFVNDWVKINGENQGRGVILNGQGNVQILYIGSGNGEFRGGNVTNLIELCNLQFKNGYAYPETPYVSPSYGVLGGGAIGIGESYVKVSNCLFQNNSSSGTGYSGGGNGGAISSWSSHLHVERCTFIDNVADCVDSDGQGGAVYCFTGPAEILCSTFINNRAGREGNSRRGDGGAIHSYGSPIIANCTFVDNKAIAGSGGAIYASSSGRILVNNIFWNNTASGGTDVSGSSGSFYSVYEKKDAGQPEIDDANNIYVNQMSQVVEFTNKTGIVNGVEHIFYPMIDDSVAAGSGVFLWHSQDWMSVAYSQTVEGEKKYLKGNQVATQVVRVDQLGRFVNIPSRGAVLLPVLVVTSNADNGEGTLRNAIAAALDGDTITFDLPREASTITLSSRLSVGANVFTESGIFIDGFNNGIGVTINGGDASGLFSFDGGNVVDFANINFAHARAAYGSAVDIYGSDVAFRNCAFMDNAATSSGAAIRNRSGILTMERCSFSGNVSASSGGAIFTTGASAVTRLVNVTFSGNAVSGSGSGGAINDAGGELTLLNCTFRGNQVNNGSGGGVYTRATNLTIVNSLLVGNSASGNGKDIYTQYSGVAYKTFVGNYQGTLSGNAVTGKQESEVYSGTPLVTAVGGVSHAYCPLSASGVADGSGVFVWHDADWTTIAYSESADGTPVIVRGSGDADVLVDCDQLGNGIGTPCVGAVNICLLMVTSNADSGAGSLRNVLADAVDGDVIAFDLPAESNVIAVASTLQLPENRFGAQGVTIDGYNDGNGVVLDGGSGNSNLIMRVNGGNNVILQNVVFRNGTQAIDIGRYGKVASVSVKNCTFENNRKNSAVYNSYGTFDAENCVFRNNATTTWSGGAIANIGANCSIRNCSFASNSSSLFGGAIMSHTSKLLVIGCTFAFNTALVGSGDGGAIEQIGSGTAFIVDSTFSGNSCADRGGAVECAAATMYLINCVLVNNTDSRGSDIYNSGTMLMYNSVYGSTYGNINGDKESNFSGKTAADVFSGGLATRTVDGVTHSYYPTLPSGFAAGPGIYLWHNDDWSAIAYTREARGVKTYILGNEGADSRLLDDQLGATITGYASIGAIFTPHEHANTYSAEGNVLTESCTCRHKETATVTAANATYDGTAHETGSVAYSRDWLAGTLNIAYANNVNAGTATASISQGGATASAEFTIAKRALTITAKPKTLTVYLIDPEGNDPVTVSGLQGGDTLETLDGTLELTYKLIPSGKTSQNYDISYVGGLVTVQKKPVALSASGSALKAYATLADAVADTETVKYGMTVLVPDGWTEVITLPAGVTLGLQTGTDASGIVVNAPASYYKVATNENGCVKFELDPEEATPVIASDGEEAAFVVGDGDTVSVNVTNVKSGLYYGLAWSDALNGEFNVSDGGWVQASADGNLPSALTAPKGDGGGRFYRVRVTDNPDVTR